MSYEVGQKERNVTISSYSMGVLKVAEKFIRKPIKIHRESIKLPSRLKYYMKLRQLQLETRTEDIVEISEHYNMLVQETTKKAGHTALPYKNPEKGKHWIHFETVYEICRLKDWNPKVYLEAQFKRAKGWKKIPYPYPNSLYSDSALKYFISYYGEMRRKYEKDANKKRRVIEKQTMSIQDRIRTSIEKDCNMLKNKLKGSSDREKDKALIIFQSWVSFSPFYLWSIPWFHEITGDLRGKHIDSIKIEFDRINKSPMMQEVISKHVQKMEQQNNIPDNISL